MILESEKDAAALAATRRHFTVVKLVEEDPGLLDRVIRSGWGQREVLAGRRTSVRK